MSSVLALMQRCVIRAKTRKRKNTRQFWLLRTQRLILLLYTGRSEDELSFSPNPSSRRGTPVFARIKYNNNPQTHDITIIVHVRLPARFRRSEARVTCIIPNLLTTINRKKYPRVYEITRTENARLYGNVIIVQ